jgi:hypothetical protein
MLVTLRPVEQIHDVGLRVDWRDTRRDPIAKFNTPDARYVRTMPSA